MLVRTFDEVVHTVYEESDCIVGDVVHIDAVLVHSVGVLVRIVKVIIHANEEEGVCMVDVVVHIDVVRVPPNVRIVDVVVHTDVVRTIDEEIVHTIDVVVYTVD